MGDKLFNPEEAGLMSNITHLSITNCDLGVLKANVFQGLGNLQTLTLDYCEITDIENSFKHLENLKELSLAYCEGDEQNQTPSPNEIRIFFDNQTHLLTQGSLTSHPTNYSVQPL